MPLPSTVEALKSAAYPRSDVIMKNDAELQAELRALSTADGNATVYNNEKGLEAKRDAIRFGSRLPADSGGGKPYTSGSGCAKPRR